MSESLWQTFPDFLSLSNNTDIFRELLAKNTTHFSRVYIKQYWHFQRVPSKLNYGKNFFQSSYQTILTDLKLTSNSTHTFTELLPDNSKKFFESLTGHLNRPKILKRKIPKYRWGKLAYTHETDNFAINYSSVYMIGYWWLYGRIFVGGGSIYKGK